MVVMPMAEHKGVECVSCTSNNLRLLLSAWGVNPKSTSMLRVSLPSCEVTCMESPNSLTIVGPGG